MRIRKYSTEDAKEVSDLVVRNLLEINVKDYSCALMSSLSASYTPDAVNSAANEKDAYVVSEGGKVVATAALLDDGWIHDVFVDPLWHCRGIGSALMAHLEDLAKSRGFRSVAIPSSITAVGFYDRLGYTRLREIVSAEGLTEVLMEKEL